MIYNKEKDRLGWEKFFSPPVLRENLIAASIFLAAFELLKSAIVGRIRSFFGDKFRNGEWIASDEYKRECLDLDKSPLRASLMWLKKMAAIDDADIVEVNAIREHRNDLAHDLMKYLGTADAEVDIRLLGRIHALVIKVERWWFREVWMTTDPIFDGQVIEEKDMPSGNAMLIEAMLDVATGTDGGKWLAELHNRFGTAPGPP